MIKNLKKSSIIGKREKKMPILEVDNGFRKDIPELGKIKPFSSLSPKRITKCVRETLREEYGVAEVIVECFAEFKKGI